MTTATATYHERHVLQMVGYENEDEWTDCLILLARMALELCYYEDRAADWMIQQLRKDRWIKYGS